MAKSDSITKNAQVPGVLKQNEEIRNEMLQRISLEDANYVKMGLPTLGKYAEFKDKAVSPITKGQELMEYTHDKKTHYGAAIERQYVVEGSKPFEVKNVYPGDFHQWDGNYFENFNPDNEIRKTGDEELLIHWGWRNMANDRRFLMQKYITPGLLSVYGINPYIDGINADRFETFNHTYDIFDENSGHMADFAEAQVHIVHDLGDGEDNSLQGKVRAFFLKKEAYDPSNDLNTRYLNLNYANADKYYQEEFSKDNIATPYNPFYEYDWENEKFDTEKFAFSRHKIGEIPTTKNKYMSENEGDKANENRADIFLDENNEWDMHMPLQSGLGSALSEKSLLKKTANMFKSHKIKTMVGRFCDGEEGEASEVDSTVRKEFGASHGRNLLRKNTNGKTNGYNNPYCRVWTYHHQYDQVQKLIRPFLNDYTEESNFKTIEEIQGFNNEYRAFNEDTNLNGGVYLDNNTVLNKNGFVNITPTSEGENSISVKKCMFAIENLAWKDVKKDLYLSDEQIGPNGGRIMWFPPYDLDFQENVNVQWAENTFISRGEPVYSYKNTTRDGTLSFSILVDHPSVMNSLTTLYKDANDDDILRFFAGCGFFEKKSADNSNENDNRKAEEDNGGHAVNPQEALSPEKGNKIVFYVFYPNNYSGNYNNGNSIKDLKGNERKDEDAFKYLIFGQNISIKSDFEEWTGFEVGNPITQENNPEHIHHMGKDKKYHDWYYRCDADLLNQVLDANNKDKEAHSNYRDFSNYYLNSKLSKTERLEATHTFTEIYMAYKKCKDELTPDEENYLANKVRIGEVEKLIKIFKTKTFDGVLGEGGATIQDKPNSKSLSKRRVKSVIGFLNGLSYKDGLEPEIKDLIFNDPMTDPTTVNSYEAKSRRFAKITLTYDSPSIVKVDNATIEEDKKDDVHESQNEVNANKVNKSKYINRVDLESDYFKTLSERDPLVFKEIKKKFNYFNPAFHSISPEGFNARLTFLQQCTRQGNTLEDDVVRNLTFGRMPVCILRIGDFIHTRIIIKNMTINYAASNGIQWDLNPEGTGVQPMYAKITLGISILGGQSLVGPINRLQNAISFNYYANTGVYDNRSDRIEQEDGQKPVYKHVFNAQSNVEAQKGSANE